MYVVCTVRYFVCTLYNKAQLGVAQVVTKRCRLFRLTNRALACEPKCRGGGVAGSQPMSLAVHRAQINCGDLTPYTVKKVD